MNLEQLKAALVAARARPNPPQNFAHDRGEAASTAHMYGAVTRINRYGFGGAWCGYDYLDREGRVVLRSMAASGGAA